jgi:hypothetical protein
MKSRISIIVTCFNQAHCIAKTLESVATQTYNNWECIIVDDGSTDTSQEKIQGFIEDDERFRYIYQENAGVSQARNTGFALAKGDYINFLDGDDTFLPDKLEKQLIVFHKHADVDICICDHQYYDELKKTYAYYKFESIQAKPLKQLLFGWHNGVAFPLHAVLYRRDIWYKDEKPFPEDYPHRCEDWVFNVLVALKGHRYYWLNQVLCNYHMSQANYTAETKKLAKASIRAAYYLNPLIPENYQENFIEETLNNAFNLVLENEKPKILKASGNWRLGNTLTRPFFKLLKYIRK